jgi:dihydroorotase
MVEDGIDFHVHCRDGKQAYKETIGHVFEIADSQGVKKIGDMPNTYPPIVGEEQVINRLKLVPENRKDDYFLWMGTTADPNQLLEAVECYEKYPSVIGMKMFAGQSVGDLTINSIDGQRKVYESLKALDYRGVIAVHCEKEEFLRSYFDPQRPMTHSLARPKIAEIESIKDQIMLVRETNFNGTLHIAHISCPESVDLVEEARKSGIKITCEVTPHHIMWDESKQNSPEGLLYKMNPPLREKRDVMGLRELLLAGKINRIGTDHAPHTRDEKLSAPYFSGYPSLTLYDEFVNYFLPKIGASDELISRMTFSNVYEAFKKKLDR